MQHLMNKHLAMSRECPSSVSPRTIQYDTMHGVSACKFSSIYQNYDTKLQSSPTRSYHLGIYTKHEPKMNQIIINNSKKNYLTATKS